MTDAERAALLTALRGQQPQQPAQQPTMWDRLKALVTLRGVPWADNANAMLPDEVSARQAVMKKRAQDAMMDEMNRSQ